MADLAVKYMGLSLRNPIIVSSSGLTDSAEKIRRCADAGAGAVVTKSIFEEQIQAETQGLQGSWQSAHPEAADYISQMTEDLNLAYYLKGIEDAKSATDIPVIASLNCVSDGTWTEFASRIEDAGADALELNTYLMVTDPYTTSEEIEKRYLDILSDVLEKVDIPVSVKLGKDFTNLVRLVDLMAAKGAAAVVLFNRYFRVTIDVDTFSLRPDKAFSTPDEIVDSLRWISILSGKVKCDLAATTGVHTSTDVLRQVMAGASAVEACSVFHQKGLEIIPTMLNEMDQWLELHSFKSIERVRGLMSQKQSETPAAYQRTQYLRAYFTFEP